MTDVTPLIRAGTQIIQAYGPAGVKVNGAMVSLPAIIMADETISWDGDIQSLVALAGRAELILLARSPDFDLIASNFNVWRGALRAAGIAIEVMDLGAVCRTYNVLMAEGRKVAAVIKSV